MNEYIPGDYIPWTIAIPVAIVLWLILFVMIMHERAVRRQAEKRAARIEEAAKKFPSMHVMVNGKWVPVPLTSQQVLNHEKKVNK